MAECQRHLDAVVEYKGLGRSPPTLKADFDGAAAAQAAGHVL